MRATSLMRIALARMAGSYGCPRITGAELFWHADDLRDQELQHLP